MTIPKSLEIFRSIMNMHMWISMTYSWGLDFKGKGAVGSWPVETTLGGYINIISNRSMQDAHIFITSHKFDIATGVPRPAELLTDPRPPTPSHLYMDSPSFIMWDLIVHRCNICNMEWTSSLMPVLGPFPTGKQPTPPRRHAFQCG